MSIVPNDTVCEQPTLGGPGSGFASTSASRNKIWVTDRPIHDWYRFVLSYPPHLVREYLNEFGVDYDSIVLDPFCGTGTTMVEAKKLGIASIGIEALPLSAFAARTKLDWDIEPACLREDAESTAALAHASLHESGAADAVGGPMPNGLRAVPNDQMRLIVTNSISPLPLHKVLYLRDAIANAPERSRSHLRLALARNLPTEIGNLRFGPEIGLGAIRKDVAVIEPWRRRVAQYADDIERYRSRSDVPARVILGDARDASEYLPKASIDAVVTSPPYPNEKDYTRAVRLESVILDLLADRDGLRDVKKRLVRSNSRSVYKGDDDDRWLAPHQNILDLADHIEQRRIALGKTSGFERMYHRVTKLYFGGMARHLASLRPSLKPGAWLAYVVGDQASYFRVMIHTGMLLAQIAGELGYEVIRRDIFRTRQATATRTQINEEALLLRWPG